MIEPPRTFETFFRDEYDSIVGVVTAIVGDQSEAEAVAQDAFVQAMVRWRRLSRYDRPGAWVRRVAIRDAVRLVQRRAEPTGDVPAETTKSDRAAEDIDLHRSLTTLPARQRVALTLFYLEGWSTDEIAAALDCAPATVRVHLHRGRLALASHPLVSEACDG